MGIMKSIVKTSRIVSVEEGWPQSGVGSEITAVAVEEAFDYLDAPIERGTGADIPTPYAANLEKSAFPTVDDIVTAAERACYRSKEWQEGEAERTLAFSLFFSFCSLRV